jgi:hypothetical protein
LIITNFKYNGFDSYNYNHVHILFPKTFNRAEMMKKSNGVYFPEEVVSLFSLYLSILDVHIRIQYLRIDFCEHCSETLQVVHAAPTGC